VKPPGSSPGTSRRRTRLPVGSIVAVVGLVIVGLTIGHAQRAARSGEELYIDRFGCWNCHGQTGAGGAGPSILKSQLSLRKFVTSVRLPVQTMPRFSQRLAFDSRGRLFVADRGNNRIQIFSQDGTFLEAWRQFGRVSDIFIDGNDVIYAADSESNDRSNPGWARGIRVGSAKDGTVWYFIPDPGAEETGGVESVAADVHGAVLAATIRVGALAVKKYVKAR